MALHTIPLAISVVVPSRSTRAMTVQCLTSVRDAAPLGSQVVLVDDASEDDTVEVVRRRHPEVELVCLDRCRGFSAAANAGVARASAPVVLVLNSDTLLPTGSVDALLEVLDSEPSYGVLGAQLVYPDGTPQWSGGLAPGLGWLLLLSSGLAARLGSSRLYRSLRAPQAGRSPADARRPRRVEWVSGAAMAFRRETWAAAGPFDESYQFYGQDLDFCLRASAAGWAVGVLPAFRVVHYHGATIRRESAAAVASQDPALLWTDLLRWAHGSRGGAWGRRARCAVLAGARLRLAARALALPFLSGERRRCWQRESAIYRRAAGAVRTVASAREAG